MAIAMELVAQRLIILRHALHQADERRDEGHDSLESPPIGRRDVLPVKVGEIYVKPFECRWGWFDRRGFRRGCRHFPSLPCSVLPDYIPHNLFRVQKKTKG